MIEDEPPQGKKCFLDPGPINRQNEIDTRSPSHLSEAK